MLFRSKQLAPGACVALAPGLAPGAGLELRLGVSAPYQAGRYFLVWDVHDSGTWLSVRGVAPGVVPVRVQRPGGPLPAMPQAEERPAVAALSASWPPELSGLDRRQLWQAAYAMWREHPWLGVGPDNFRWLQGRYTGQPFPQTFVFANNTYAEAAATTGMLGLLALVGALLASAVAAAGRLARADNAEEARFAAVCLGLVVSVAVHGLVDHVLEFTGHYLFLGLLVGAIAGTPRADRMASPPPPR